MISGTSRSFETLFVEEFGDCLNKALMFSQMMWSIQFHADRHQVYGEEFCRHGKWWMKDTDKSWALWGPWRDVRSWQRDKKWLRENGWIFVEQLNKANFDQTSFIAVNWEKVKELRKKAADRDFSGPSDVPHDDTMSSSDTDTMSSSDTDMVSSSIIVPNNQTNNQTKVIVNPVQVAPVIAIENTPPQIIADKKLKPKIRKRSVEKKANFVPKDYTPSEAEVRLSELWKLQLDRCKVSPKKRYSDIVYAYWMRLLLTSDLDMPEPTEETVACFIGFLINRPDAQPGKFPGWGSVLKSIPASFQKLSKNPESTKLESAWAVFSDLYDEKVEKPRAEADTQRLNEAADKAMGLENLAF